jgi:hypothetical protein
MHIQLNDDIKIYYYALYHICNLYNEDKIIYY